MFTYNFNLDKKNVLISLDTKSMGDTIAWFPYIEEFRKKNNCNIWVSTFWNILFKGHPAYSNLNFVEPGATVDNLYASYSIGCYDNKFKNPVNWRSIPLQKVCSDILGLSYKEIPPKIAISPKKAFLNSKYITISEHSTFACKYWQRKGAWQKIVDYFDKNDYKVMVISKEETKLKNIIDMTNRSIEETITNIYHSELFIGVSSGPAWLAWALGIPVVMISGYSAEFSEFNTNMQRIINKQVCNSCFNDYTLPIDKGNWNWCPRYENTPRQFECTKEITFDMVKKGIERILNKE